MSHDGNKVYVVEMWLLEFINTYLQLTLTLFPSKSGTALKMLGNECTQDLYYLVIFCTVTKSYH